MPVFSVVPNDDTDASAAATEPYWVARYFGFLPDTHLVLAWK